MSKTNSTGWLKRLMIMVAVVLFGLGSANAATVTPVSLGSTFSIANDEICHFTASDVGYVMVEFTTPMDMTSPNGVFFTYVPAWNDADYVLDAVECNGVAQGKATIIMYDGIQQYEQYSNASKIVYAVDKGNNYCVWNRSGAGNTCTLTFSTTMPDLNGSTGGDGGGDNGGGSDAEGTLLSSVPSLDNFRESAPVTAPANGYILLEFSSPITLKDSFAAFYTYVGYADEAVPAIDGNGIQDGEGVHTSYGGPYPIYKDATKLLYKVTKDSRYCLYNTSGSELPSCQIYFYTEKPSINGGAGGDGGGGNDGPTVNENDYTYQPSYNEVLEFGLGNVVISWPRDVDVTVLNENAIWIDNPDIAGNGLKAPNDLWIGHELEAVWDPSSPPLPNTLKIAFVNSSIMDMNTWTLLNPYPYEVSIAVNVPAGSIALNGVPTTEDIEINYTLPAGTQSFYIPEPNSTPQNNTYHLVSTIDKITLDWDNWYVGYGDNFNSYAAAARNVKIYISENNEFPNLATSPYIEVSLAGQNFMPSTTRFGQQLVITPNEALNDPTKWYTLIIPAGTLSFKNDNDDLVDYNEEIELYYTVAGSTGTIVIPSQQQRIQSSQFKGLEIEGGDYTVVDASQIALYQGYYDETDTSVTTTSPIAYGVNQSTGDKIIIGFPSAGSLYSGAYTILVPQGAIEGFSVPRNQGGFSNPANQIQFVIEGNDAPISAMKLSSDPQPGVVDEIESVRIWWADYTRIMHATNPGNSDGIGGSTTVNGTMSVNGGTPTNIVFNITKSLIQSAEDEDTGEADGVDYQYSLLYTPSSPITAPGKYTFTLPANSVRVYYNNSSEPLNDEVVLEYTIEGQVSTGTDVTFSFTGVDNAYELVTIIDENMNPVELDGPTVDYSFSSEDASLLVGINPIYNLTITGQGVEESYDTFMVGEGDLMDEDMIVYPLTLYPGINGKTLVFNVTDEQTSGEAEYLQVAMGTNMDDIVADPATDSKLLPNGQGGFSGVINVEKTGNQAFCFYSVASDGTITYYSGESGGYGANWKLDFSTQTTYTYNDVMEWKKSNKGSWSVSGYPEGFVGGQITAVVTLPEGDNPGSATFTFEGTQSGTVDLPAELLVLVDNSDYGSFSLSNSPATFKLGENGTYEGDFNVGGSTYFKFYGVDNGTPTWYASQPMFIYDNVDFSTQETYTYNTITTAINSSMGVGGWSVAPNTEVHAVIDLVKKTVVLTKGTGSGGSGSEPEPEPSYPDQVYIAWGTNMFNVTPSAYDQMMINGEEGVFTAQIEVSSADPKKSFRLYSDEGGTISYISQRSGSSIYGVDQNISFLAGLEFSYDNLFETTNGDNAGSWTLYSWPAGVTEGTLYLDLNLVDKVLNLTLVPATTEPEPEPEPIYFTFSGVDNGYELVSAMNDEMKTITFHSGINEYMPVSDGEQIYFQVNDKYELTITNTADLQEGYSTYIIGEPDVFNGLFMQTLTLYEGAEGTSFNIEVKEAETVTPEPVYMTGASIDPRSGSRLDNMGNVMIAWTQYRLDINPPEGRDYVNLPLDGVHIYINGVENTTWMNLMGASLRAINTKGSNEGGGGPATDFDVAEILLSPGDAAFHWSGTINIVLPEGLVKSTSGAISPAFDLTYYVGGKNVVSPAIFTPEEGAKFLPGEAVVYASWEGYSVTAINGGVAVNSLDEEGEISESINISNGQLSIEDGKLKIDLSSLPVGTYQMWVQQGAVDLGDNAINADAPYAFTIAEVEVPADPTESDIDPTITLDQENNTITISYDGNDLEITDDWSLTITDSEGNVTNVPADKVSIDDKGNLVIDLSELGIEGGGDYTLTLGEYSVLIDEDGTITYNPELVYTFKTSAIAILTADGSKSWKVYNMNGVNVLNTDNAGDLNQLEKGLYIINGKKVLVK